MIRNTTASSATSILERAGFEIRNTRAVCPYCQPGHRVRKLTVALRGELWYCHRCHAGGSVRGLASQQGIALPAPRIRKASIPKQAFREWLSRKMAEMAAEEQELVRRWRSALAALGDCPEPNFSPFAKSELTMTEDEAWDALAAYYHRQRYFQLFWTSCGDKVGRYWLFRSWRSHGSR